MSEKKIIKPLLPIITRNSTIADREAVVELAKADPEAIKFLALDKGDKWRRLKQHCGSRQGHVVVAELNGRLVGVLHKIDRKGNRYFVEEIISRPEFRGCKIGTFLMLHLLTETKCTGLEAKSFAVNHAVATLNRKVGMRSTSKTESSRMCSWQSTVSDVSSFDVIDAHVHLTPAELLHSESKKKALRDYPMTSTAERLISSMDRTGIRRALLLPVPVTGVIAEKVSECVSEITNCYPERFRFAPLVSTKISKWIRKGASAFKEHSSYMGCDRNTFITEYKKMADAGKPLILHPYMGMKADRIRFTLKHVPDLKIILCHAGRDLPFSGKGVLETASDLVNFPSVYFETSTVWDSSVIRELINIVGDDRVLFGSDHPFALLHEMPDRVMIRELAFIRACGFSSSSLEKILVINAKNLFGF